MRRAALVAAAALALAGCGGSGGDGARVEAAASLTEAFTALDSHARYDFGGSSELARHVEDGAPADVFASADAGLAVDLYRKGLVERPRLLAANHVVLAVPRGDGRVRGLADLARPGTRVVLAQPGVPAGDRARSALERLPAWPRIRANVVSEEADVKGVVAKLAAREADAGFVYATDVRAAAADVRAVGAAVASTTYAIAVVRAGDARRGRAFVARATGPGGRRALLRAGFVLPGRAGRPL